METIKCRNCKKELTTDMQIEYSEKINGYFCNPDCASDFYFDYMGSSCVDFNNLKEEDVVIKNNKLVREYFF